AGTLAGLAAAAKYTGGLALVFVLVLAITRGRSGRRARVGVAAGAALVAFAIPCLVFVWHPLPYLHGFAFISRNLVGRGQGLPIGWVFHTTVTLPFGLGLGTFALSLAGLALALARRRPPDLALVVFSLAYLAVTGAGHEDFFRYELPLLPALCLLAGALVGGLPPRLVPAGAAAAVLLALPSAYASVETDRILGTTDTRALAAAWMVSHLPPGASIQAAYYASPFYDAGQVRANQRWVSDRLAASYAQGRYTTRFRIDQGRPGFTLLASGPPEQAPMPDGRDALFRISAYSGLPPRGAVYDPLDSFWLPIWGFSDITRPGPSISIIRSG
ncbi:MAG: hypothetical protein ACREPA_04515, partial [Candidatus Dormibacteraceae bacterium]